MITYEKLWQTMKERNITTYHLITYHNISRGLISRLKKGEAMTTNTLNNLCNIHIFPPEIFMRLPHSHLYTAVL